MRTRLIAGLLNLLARLPLSWNRQLSLWIGRLLAHTPNSLRRISSINLQLCLPELSKQQQRQLLKRSLIETTKTALEAGPLWLWPPEQIQALMVEPVIGEDAVKAALQAGHGVILATPHHGSWEMAGQIAAARWGITSLYKPPRLAGLDQLIREGREQLGARLVATDAKGIRSLYETLSRGDAIGILPDQDPGQSGGIFAPFFGIPANSMILLSRLARKTGAAVFICFCERLPGTQGYQLHCLPAPAGIDAADATVAATAMNAGIEACVRVCPEQYQWSYRRFRTRPAGEPNLYGTSD